MKKSIIRKIALNLQQALDSRVIGSWANCLLLNQYSNDGGQGPLSGRLKQIRFFILPSNFLLFEYIFKLLFIVMLSTSSFFIYSQGLSVCDNGGFEDGFTYYTGSVSSFMNGSGSENCYSLTVGGIPCTFTNVTIPVNHRFEIVTTGTDPITSVNRVIFGNQSAMINSYINYFQFPICNHRADINRITRTFLVTEENRNFTVWYCAVLENPGDHDDQQPYFSIYCDLADNSQFCFDGVSIPGRTTIFIDDCHPQDPNQIVKFTDWACHRVHIPAEQVGNIATLEITVADCARGGHWGYAYIDGICESCDGSSYGGAGLKEKPDLVVSCDGDSITIKGSYTTPTIDGNYTILDNIVVPGFSIYGLTIDTASKTFKFRIIKADFQAPNDACRDVIAYLKFKNSSGNFLPDVPTNAIEICYEDFIIPEVVIFIGNCHRNNPNDNNYSDDYYYVDFTIQDADNVNWTLERQLDDPPSGESGRYFLNSSGFGNGIYKLGPFLIQEGSWILILNHNHCSDTFQIIPPDYCSGCNALSKTKITNITCYSGNTWSYDLKVEGNPSQGSTYRINGETFDRFFGTQYTINVGNISQSCIDLVISYRLNNNPVCEAKFNICPPIPCTNNQNCDFEAYIENLNCINNGASYSINFITKGGGFPCVRINGANTNLTIPFSNPLGPFTEDVELILFACNTPFDCTCSNTNCYKMYYVDKPDDCPRDPDERSNFTEKILQDELTVIPNPVNSGEFIIKSKLNTTNFEIYNASGTLIKSLRFEGHEYKMSFNYNQGVYYLKYFDSLGTTRSIKIIKL